MAKSGKRSHRNPGSVLAWTDSGRLELWIADASCTVSAISSLARAIWIRCARLDDPVRDLALSDLATAPDCAVWEAR